MPEQVDRRDGGVNHLEKGDVILLAGVLAAIATLALIFAIVPSGHLAMFGIVWGWIVNLSVWIYLIVAAI
jgi:hypothetical protein